MQGDRVVAAANLIVCAWNLVLLATGDEAVLKVVALDRGGLGRVAVVKLKLKAGGNKWRRRDSPA
jgi:hypothetical protein